VQRACPHSSARLVLPLLSLAEYIVQQYKSRHILVRYSTKVACRSINEIHLTYPVSA
jgi:hypothetical protein